MNRTLAFAVALALLPAHAAAQCGARPEPCEVDAPRWTGELATLAANAFLHGVTSGTIRALKGGSFEEGFARGALGGAGVYAGKRIAAQRFDGAGLLGRQIAAVGASVTRNAIDGLQPLQRIVLPVGPARVHLRGTHVDGVTVDAVAIGWIAWAVAEDGLDFDFGSTLSAGAPVFRTRNTVLSFGDDSVHAAGATSAGVILLADVPAFGETFEERAFAHERVHVLQQDQLQAIWLDPAESWLAARWQPARHANRWLDLNISTELLRTFGRFFPEHAERPWELESIFFAR